jgi:hypothetical protein
MGRILGSVIGPGRSVSLGLLEALWTMTDGRIPLVAFTAQVFFGNRAWQLWGRRPWIKWFFTIVPTITMLCGVA